MSRQFANAAHDKGTMMPIMPSIRRSPPEWPIPPGIPQPRPRSDTAPRHLPAWAERLPSGEDWLSQRLFDNRIVLVRGNVDRDAATRLAAQLLALDADSSRPVRLQLDTASADLTAALVVADTLDLLRVTTHGLVIGEVGGGSLVILIATNHRSALRHARLRLTEPSPDAALRHRADQPEAIRQQGELLAEFVERLALVTHRPSNTVAVDLRSRRYLTATEAVKYGLIHEIAGASPVQKEPR